MAGDLDGLIAGWRTGAQELMLQSVSSTDDVKPWLVAHFASKGQASRPADWKRSKSKNDLSQVVRTFDRAILGSVDVVGTPLGLALMGEDPAPSIGE